MDTFQNAGENPSSYLRRLQVALSLAVKRGGVPESDVNKHLLNQFCRGCWDNTLISSRWNKGKLKFHHFLNCCCPSEEKRIEKLQRHRGWNSIWGNTKQRVSSCAHLACEEEEKEICAAFTSFTKQLTQQMAAIQQELNALTLVQSYRPQSSTPRVSQAAQPRMKQQPMNSAPSSLKPGFCFRFGEDGHTSPSAAIALTPLSSALKESGSVRRN